MSFIDSILQNSM